MLNAAMMAELLGGAARYKALRCLYEHPTRAFGTRELASAAGIDPSNASRWLRRWSDLGLVERGIQRGGPVFKASRDPGLKPLAQLLQQDTLTSRVLLARVEQLGKEVAAAAIFGSSARGQTQEGSDIDLLLLTDMSQLKAQAFFKAAGRTLGRPVNVLAYPREAWDEALRRGDVLASDIASQPVIMLKGTLDAAQT